MDRADKPEEIADGGGGGASAGGADGADGGGVEALAARARRGGEIILESPGGRDGALGVFSAAMTVSAAWLLGTGALEGGGAPAGAASGLFFAGLAVLRLRRWRAPRLRRIRLTPEALEIPGFWGPRRAPWRALSNIRAVPHASVLPGRGGGQMIVFDVGAGAAPGPRRAGLHPHYGLSAEDTAKLLEACRAAALRRPPPE